MDSPVVITGSITVGFVASLVIQLVKNVSWFPKNTLLIRVLVALICLGINAIYASQNGGIDLTALLNAFISYATAAATYDHLLKD